MKQNNKDKQNNTVQLNFIFVLFLNSLEQFSSLVLWRKPFFICVLQDLRLPSVTTIAIPEGYDWREMLTYIMKHHHMEMTGGLGPSIGMVS